ncbi:MAG: TrmB family transcriptional regulator [archaeon]
MNLDDVQLQTLINMGLTHRQASVYLYLAMSGVSSVNAISKGTKIARQHLYEIIEALHNMGLVQKLLENPLKLKASSPEIGLSMLMEKKSIEHKKTMKNAQDLIETIKFASPKPVSGTKQPDLALISGIKPIVAEIGALHDRAQTTVDCLINWRGTLIAFEHSPNQYLRLLENGVKFRMIMDVPPEKEQFEAAIKPLVKSPCCEIKYIDSKIPAFLLMRDNKEILMSSSPTEPLETPYLQIYNVALVSLIREYYELMWKTN